MTRYFYSLSLSLLLIAGVMHAKETTQEGKTLIENLEKNTVLVSSRKMWDEATAFIAHADSTNVQNFLFRLQAKKAIGERAVPEYYWWYGLPVVIMTVECASIAFLNGVDASTAGAFFASALLYAFLIHQKSNLQTELELTELLIVQAQQRLLELTRTT